MGLRVGLLRPITLYPFPSAAFESTVGVAKAFLVVEMSMGQMLDDVKIAVAGRRPISFYGRTGGIVPTPEEIVKQVRGLAGDAGA
jgi:2-oxoglutarate ferredoxin oxidoreductase subunit alpha